MNDSTTRMRRASLLPASTLLAVLALAWVPTPAPAGEGGTQFGVMLGGSGLMPQKRVELIQKLGVTYVRPWDVNIVDWTGHHADTELLQKTGLRIVLTVRSSGHSVPSPTASKPPADLALYKRRLGDILDHYRPALLVVEDEETSNLSWAGTPEKYLEVLTAACEVAHAKELRCTNGGLGSAVASALAWDHMRNHGETDHADDFFRRTIDERERALIHSPDGMQKLEHTIAEGRTLLGGYAAAHCDFVNFHWYEADTTALEETVAFLKGATGLPAVTNEIGQRDSDSGTVTEVLETVHKLGLPIVVWSSMDRQQSRALQNPDGSMRSSGTAFARYVKDAASCSACGLKLP